MTNRVAEYLEIEKPIVQAPMAYLTDAKLVASVSNAGGLGVLGGIESGRDNSLEILRQEIRKVKSLTDKPFGVNFDPAPIKAGTDATSGASQSDVKVTSNDLNKAVGQVFEDYKGYDIEKDETAMQIFDVMVEEKVPVAVYVGPAPMKEWFDKLENAGIKVLFRAITPYLTTIKNAVKAGAKAIVATGFDAGSTLPTNAIGTFSCIPMVKEAAGDVPILAAGGITSTTTAKTAAELGAEGIYAGTAFLASEEAPIADNIKQLMITATADDMKMFRTPNGYFRGYKGGMTDKLMAMDAENKTPKEIWDLADGYVCLKNGMLDGDLDKGIASFGLGVGAIKSIDSAATIVDRLNAGLAD